MSLCVADGATVRTTAALDDLADLLQRERGLLDLVRFRFVEVRLLLNAGEMRYLPRATAEVGHARVLACEVDLLRAASVLRSGMPGGGRAPALRELADAAPRPWAGILADHRDGLCTTVAEIEAIGAANADLARAGIGSAAEALDGLTGVGPVGPRGSGVGVRAGTVVSLVSQPIDLAAEEAGGEEAEVSLLLAERTYQDVISTATRLRMPALRRFLQ
jgi:hypothetical protein